MLGIIIVMALVIVFGISWGMFFKKGYTQDEYGTELAKRDQRIEQLEDSLRTMRAKLAIYQKAAKWFRDANDEDLQKGIDKIRKLPKDMPLP